VSADSIEAWLARQGPAVQPLVRRLRALVREELPDVPEHIDRWDVLRFGGRGMSDWTCYVSGHKAHANLGFARGAALPDPDGLVEGTGKSLRHVKVRSLADAERPGLRALLRAARELDRSVG
jgi:hypothetical protein